jgi:hypothetical protein
MITSGSQVAISGKTHNRTIPKAMANMKGKAPLRIVGKDTSGAIPLIT